jgi:hypothetical protein
MGAEPSTLARLAIAYHETFGRHVPEPALRRAEAGRLVALIQDSLVAGEALAEAEWGHVLPMEFGPGGCIVRDKSPERPTPTKRPNGDSLQ